MRNGELKKNLQYNFLFISVEIEVAWIFGRKEENVHILINGSCVGGNITLRMTTQYIILILTTLKIEIL